MLGKCAPPSKRGRRVYFAAKNCDPNDLSTSIRSENAIRKLLALGVDPNWTDADYGYTALMWAAAWGHEAICEMLVGAGASIEAQDNYGRTALFWAAEEGKLDLITLELEFLSLSWVVLIFAYYLVSRMAHTIVVRNAPRLSHYSIYIIQTI